MKNDETTSPSDSELLETRIVAWVLGEASPFEAEDLTRRVAANPELAVFKRRIEAVHGLAGTALKRQKDDLRLSPERRQKLLAVIGAAGPAKAEAEAEPAPTSNVTVFDRAARRLYQKRWLIMASAASIMFGIFLSSYAVYRQRQEFASKEYAKKADVGRVREMEDDLRRAQQDNKRREEAESRKNEQLFARDYKWSGSAALEAPMPAGSAARVVENDYTIPPKDEVVKLDEVVVEAQREGHASAIAAQSPRMNFSVKVSSDTFGEASPGRRDGDTPSFSDEAPVQVPPSPSAAPVDLAQPIVAATELPLIGGSVGGIAGERVALPQSEIRERYEANRAVNEQEERVKAQMAERDAVAAAESARRGYAQMRSETELKKRQSAGGKDGPVAAESDAIVAFQFKRDWDDQAGRHTAEEKLLKAEAPPPPVQLGHSMKDDAPLARAKGALEVPGEIHTRANAVSTFSLHVSDVSFRLAQAALARGELPDANRIRPEEFYNAFDYGDPAASLSEKVACRIEQSAHPFAQQRNLLRIGVKVPAAGRSAKQELRLTVLLDTSGSMERADRAASVRRGLEVLASLLGPNDRLTVIGFARQPRLLVDAVSGNRAKEAVAQIARTPAEGGTNLEEAIKLGTQLATRHYRPDGQNRLILMTDGAANLGNADPAQLAQQIERLRQQGLAFDACGVGLDGLDDEMLEALTRKGDGRYYVLNSPEEADRGFARQLAGALRPAAENVKVQVRFNPARVGNYRLIGFEQHRLKTEDFRNDKVDAAELAADEGATALYQVETLPQGEGEVGEVSIRFRDAATGQMVERTWTLPYDANVRRFDRASPALQLAGTAAMLAEKLRGGAPAAAIKLDELVPVVNGLRTHYPAAPRVRELTTMFEQARRLRPQ